MNDFLLTQVRAGRRAGQPFEKHARDLTDELDPEGKQRKKQMDALRNVYRNSQSSDFKRSVRELKNKASETHPPVRHKVVRTKEAQDKEQWQYM